MLETSRPKIVRRLTQEGWLNQGGKKHDEFVHPDFDASIIVPRHKTLSSGVSRHIARAAGW
ncbi:type II toxin-antitoxin system HicA family toxin [Brevundimonas sp.]|uniref:type II toxin-antitoxin system HicA family toxin n=1 Tax=Brevundimonas sp. TaxID=1871086 RepID=UPI003D14D05D